MKKFLIIYHKEDNDGVFSAAIMQKYIFDTFKGVGVSLKGVDYNILNNITKKDINKWRTEYDNLIMLDISFNDTSLMKHAYDAFYYDFIWVDHHKPIIDWSIKTGYDKIEGRRDTKHSTIYNLYKYLYDVFDLEKIPELYRVLSAYDSFSFEAEGYDKDYVFAINKAVTFKGQLSVNAVSSMFVRDVNNTDIESLLKLGKTLIQYEDFLYEDLIKNSCDTTWTLNNGNKAAVLFLQGPTSNRIFQSLIGTDIKNGVVFKRQKDGKWTVSLYNVDDDDPNNMDCGAYCKEYYNGGGHKGAAGCTISESQFRMLLQYKTF